MLESTKARLASCQLAVARAMLRVLASRLFRPLNSEKVRHIVVYRVGNIGDTVVAIPTLAAIRQAYPQAVITLVTSSGSSELPGASLVLEAFPSLVSRIVSYIPAEVKSMAGLSRLKAEVTQAGPVDLFIDLPISLQTLRRGLQEIFLARWLGSRSVIGFDLLLPGIFQSAYSRQLKHHMPKTVDWLVTLVQTGLNPANNVSASRQLLQPTAEVDWQSLRLDPTRPLLVVNAGAKLAIKCWPKASFRESISRLLQETPELQVALLGNAAEQGLNDEIAAGLSGTVVNLAGRLNLTETWALLSLATAVLSNDTGVMHMAGILNRPVFTPMGGQFPLNLWHPPGELFTPFRNPVACEACFLDACPKPEQVCLTRIAPETVAEEIGSYLQAPRKVMHAER